MTRFLLDGRDRVSGGLGLAIALTIMVGTVAFLGGVMVASIRREVRESRLRVWQDFGLSIALAVLFLTSWFGHALSQWQEFTDEQAAHGQGDEISDFLAAFSSTTLENWQSEFLQLFSFVVLAAMLIHRGSAESRDSDDRIEQALSRGRFQPVLRHEPHGSSLQGPTGTLPHRSTPSPQGEPSRPPGDRAHHPFLPLFA